MCRECFQAEVSWKYDEDDGSMESNATVTCNPVEHGVGCKLVSSTTISTNQLSLFCNPDMVEDIQETKII